MPGTSASAAIAATASHPTLVESIGELVPAKFEDGAHWLAPGNIEARATNPATLPFVIGADFEESAPSKQD